MTNAESMSADVFIDSQVRQEQEDLIVAALTALGVSVRVRVLPPLRGAEDLQWLILAALPLQSFLTSIGSKFADDAYRGFQSALSKISHKEPADHADQAALAQPAPKPVVLQDATSGIQVVLPPDLPAAGYDQLLALDLSRFRFGPVHYDQAQQRWRSELDEV